MRVDVFSDVSFISDFFGGISELESNEKWMDLGNENRYVMRVKEGRVIP